MRTNVGKSGKLFLVDLAGSEMVGKTGATGTTLTVMTLVGEWGPSETTQH